MGGETNQGTEQASGEFVYDLDKGVKLEDFDPFLATNKTVRYLNHPTSITVEIGDGFRHYQTLQAQHWNTLLRLIKEDKLGQDGLELILGGFLGSSLPEERQKRNLVYAVKSGAIPEINIPK